MDIRNYITKRKRDEDSGSETESDNLSASQILDGKKQYDTLRVFQENLTNEYFVIPSKSDNKPKCLLCKEIFSINHSFNIKRHYNRIYKESIEKKYPLNSEARNNYINQLKSFIETQRNILIEALTESQSLSLASFKIAVAQRPFSEGMGSATGGGGRGPWPHQFLEKINEFFYNRFLIILTLWPPPPVLNPWRTL